MTDRFAAWPDEIRFTTADLDLGDAAAGAADGWVQAGERFVGGDGHEKLEAVAGETVGDVEEPRQILALALLGGRADELVAVLEDEQAPAVRLLVVAILAE